MEVSEVMGTPPNHPNYETILVSFRIETLGDLRMNWDRDELGMLA